MTTKCSLFKPSDYASSTDFKAQNVKKVIWITEGKTDMAPKRMDDKRFKELAYTQTVIKKAEWDPITTLSSYHKDGIEVYQLRIDPYDC